MGKPDARDVTLEPARLADAPLLSNLLELYIHELSPMFPAVALGPDGRFGYPKLPLYWSEAERRYPFLIRRDGRVAGFVLATRGSPATDDPEVFDIAEFFVLRQHRRAGAGRQAAFLLWNSLRGEWTVRVSEANPTALQFWSGVIADYTHRSATESRRPGGPSAWRVFSFRSVPPDPRR